MKWWRPDAMIFVFWMLSFKSTFSLSSFTFFKSLFSSSSLWGYWYFSWQFWFQLVLHPVWHFMIYCVYKSNKQGDNIQVWHTPFPIWNQSVVPCPLLNVAYWPAYRFLRRQVRWSGIPISFRIFYTFYTVKGFGVVNKPEVDVFLELSCFFDDRMDIGNLISGSCAFSKTKLEHLEVHGLCTIEAWLGEFWTLHC